MGIARPNCTWLQIISESLNARHISCSTGAIRNSQIACSETLTGAFSRSNSNRCRNALSTVIGTG